MADTTNRLQLYSLRYGDVDSVLLRDLNRLFDDVYARLGAIEQRLASIEDTLADHEARIDLLEP